MMNFTKFQQGYTFITLACILAMIGICVTLLLKVGPIYMDHGKVLSALSAVEKIPNLKELSESEIRSSIDKRFNLNYVSDLKPQDVNVIKRGNYVKIEANYEVVKEIVGNLSVLVNFNDVVEVGSE